MLDTHQIRCRNGCGFRVHTDYFADKTRFQPDQCPRCGSGKLIVVEIGSDDQAPGFTYDKEKGRVLPVPGGGSAETVSIAAATAVVGYDLLQNSRIRQASRPRKLVAAGLTGSAAAGDSAIELFAGTRFLGTLYNSATGFPNRDAMLRIGETVAANEELQARVVDAPATNPLNLVLDLA